MRDWKSNAETSTGRCVKVSARDHHRTELVCCTAFVESNAPPSSVRWHSEYCTARVLRLTAVFASKLAREKVFLCSRAREYAMGRRGAEGSIPIKNGRLDALDDPKHSRCIRTWVHAVSSRMNEPFSSRTGTFEQPLLPSRIIVSRILRYKTAQLRLPQPYRSMALPPNGRNQEQFRDDRDSSRKRRLTPGRSQKDI